jgi:hypothetical protein
MPPAERRRKSFAAKGLMLFPRLVLTGRHTSTALLKCQETHDLRPAANGHFLFYHPQKRKPPMIGGFLFSWPVQAAFSFLLFIWVQTLSKASSKDSSNDLLLDFTKISFLGMVTLISATLSLMV